MSLRVQGAVTDNGQNPLITIGMPIFNGESYLRATLDSLLQQTFRDFCLIISDNASTDGTGDICSEYAFKDSRICYIRQERNLGAEANFRFVFEKADTEFFIWAAADDTRSRDFLEVNLAFLVEHPEYSGSTSPVRFSGKDFNPVTMGDAALRDEDRYERIIQFFSTWHANGRFYSIFRTKEVEKWRHLNNSHFLGSDWTLVTHMASLGKLNRHTDGWVELGVNGVSNKTNIFAYYRRQWIDWILPFNKVMTDTFTHMSGSSTTQKARVLWKLMRLNIQAFRGQFMVALRR